MNAPRLRFNEFNTEWNNRLLSELLEFKNGINADKDSYGHGIKFINVLDILNNDYIVNEKIIGYVNASEQQIQTYSVTYGDILFLRSSETREDVGKCNVYLDHKKPSVFGGFVIRGKKIADYAPLFLKLILNNSSARNQISSKSGGSTRYNVSQNILSEVTVAIPEINEQLKISSLFMLINKKIEKQQEKIENLEEMKKGMMQKIFSQELRFKDEDGKGFQEWEETSFDDLFQSKNIKQIPTVDAPLMAFTSTRGVEEKGDRFNREFLVKNENKTYKRTEFNDLIYSSNNLDVGAIGRNKYGRAVISDVYEIFKVKNTTTPEFAEILIQQKNVLHKILKYRQGALYGQYRIHAIDFLSVLAKIPLIEEQKKIGSFFSKIDEKIQIEKEKLSTLKEQKKAFIQQILI